MNTYSLTRFFNPYSLLGVVFLIVLFLAFLPMIRTGGSDSVVYLATGELYVGKLSFFPHLKLRDGYLLMTVKGEGDSLATNFQLAPLREALWAPRELYLNRDQIVFYGPLDSQSKIAETLRSAQ